MQDIPENEIIKLFIWDGRTTSGAEVPEGVYYFVIEYTDTNDESEKVKGAITLFR